MIPIIITGHGLFATSIRETIKYIIGEQPNIYFIDFNDGMGNIELQNKLENILKTLKSEQVLFLTDLAGGTPFSTSVILSEKNPKYRVFGGCNLPMIISAIELSCEDDIDSITADILSFAKDGVILFENSKNSQITEENEGI